MQANKSRVLQRGIGMLGVLCLSAVIVSLLLFALKLIPVGLEYYAIQTTLQRIANNAGLNSEADMRLAFIHQAQIDNITSVTARDLIITEREILVSYEKIIPLIEHASLVLSLDASSQRINR